MVENEVWNQCTRLIANAIIYYNAFIVDQALQALEQHNTDHLNYMKNISPIAWIHINMTGKYEFTEDREYIDIKEMVDQLTQSFKDSNIFKMQD